MLVSVCSLKGLRDKNEDKHNIILNIDNKNNNIKNINFFSIYDGHGGRDVSKFLSKTLPIYFVNNDVKYPLKKEYVEFAYNHLQKKISEMSSSKSCGSTSLTVSQYVKNNKMYLDITNLGDSKIVLCRDNTSVSLTKDHRPMWPEEKTRIEKLGGKIYFDGDDWRIKDYSVSRAFGDNDAKPFISNSPDVYRYRIEKNDKFFIMACDGLWDYVSEQDAVNFILNYSYKNNKRIKEKTVNIAEKLAQYCLKKGSGDNISIIVAFFQNNIGK